MADSGQQPTASAEVDNLVNEIFEMLMDMEVKRIDHSSQKLYFDTILRDLPSFSPEVRAERLRKFILMLQKKIQTHNIADEAGSRLPPPPPTTTSGPPQKPRRSDKSATIGHTRAVSHGEESEDSADAGMPCKTAQGIPCFNRG